MADAAYWFTLNQKAGGSTNSTVRLNTVLQSKGVTTSDPWSSDVGLTDDEWDWVYNRPRRSQPTVAAPINVEAYAPQPAKPISKPTAKPESTGSVSNLIKDITSAFQSAAATTAAAQGAGKATSTGSPTGTRLSWDKQKPPVDQSKTWIFIGVAAVALVAVAAYVGTDRE